MNKNTENSPKAVAWVRCSTEHQHTTDEQMNAIIALAAQDGYKAKDLIRIGREGASAIRHNGKMSDEYTSDVNKLCELIESGEVRNVYAWALDRIGRDEREVMWLKWKCQENNVTIKTADGVSVGSQTSMADDIVYYILTKHAEEEMRKKQARFKLGIDRNRKIGKYIGGYIAFGYKLDENNFIVIDEEQATLVRTCFSLYATGNYSLRELTKEMNQRGWDISTMGIRNAMFRTQTYIGKYDKIKYPRIIDDETWEKCQQVAKKKSTKIGKGYVANWLAAKLIKCPDCGRNYTVFNSGLYAVYKCVTHGKGWRYDKKGGEFCGNNILIPALQFDTILWNISYNREMKLREANKEDRADKLADKINVTIDKIERLRQDAEGKIEKQLDRWNDMYGEGAISREKWQKKRNATLEEQQTIFSEIARLRTSQAAMQHEWTLLMEGKVEDETLGYGIPIDGAAASRIVHNHIEVINPSRDIDGFVVIEIKCYDGEIIRWQYRAKAKNKWYMIKSGKVRQMNVPRCERSSDSGTVVFQKLVKGGD